MRRSPRTPLLASIIVIALGACAVALTGVLLALPREEPVPLAQPLLVYPVTGTLPGACPAGTLGVNGPEPTCYQVTEGLVIRRVQSIDVQRMQDGTFGISLRLLTRDSDAFAELTRAEQGGRLALVVNGRVVTAPKVDAPITGGRMVVTGRFTQASADKLAYDLTGT